MSRSRGPASFVLALAFLLAACGSPDWPVISFEDEEIAVGSTKLTVAVADTPAKRRQGLMDVSELPGVDGMLFVFETPASPAFTMRDTRLPLDIWWFGPEGQLLGSTEMAPCEAEPCVTYGSPGEILWALETLQGEYEFEPGDFFSTVGSG